MTKPYGYVRADGEGIFIYGEDKFQKIKDVVEFIPIYTEPPQRTWVGLTDEDRAEILNRKWWNFEDEFDVDGFLRLAEAKLKELNA